MKNVLSARMEEGSGRPIRRRAVAALPLVAGVFAALLIGLLFRGGLNRGMDHVTMYQPVYEQTAIAIALSDMVYDLNLGYVALGGVFDKLVRVWDRGAANGLDPILIKNDSDRTLLNEAITAATSLGPQTPGYVADGSLVVMPASDPGLVDYVHLSFELFGYRIEAMYYTFFVLLSLSSVLFVLVFRSNIYALAILVCTLFAFHIELRTGIFTFNMPTFVGTRHGSVLGIIPLWHFALLVYRREKLGPLVFVASLFQLMLLILAMSIRGAAQWMLIFILALAIVLGFWSWLRQPPELRTRRSLLRWCLPWPVVLLLIGVVAHSEYMAATLHPVYFTDDDMPYHGLWHSAIVGLAEYTDENVLDLPPEMWVHGMDADTLGAAAALAYMKRDHFASSEGSLVSPWTQTTKFRLREEIQRRVFFRAVLKNPGLAIEIYAFRKPAAIAAGVWKLIAGVPGRFWPYLLPEMAVLFLLALWSDAIDTRQLAGTASLAGGAMLFAALPPLWAWAAPIALPDLLLCTLIFLQMGIWGLSVYAGQRWLGRSDATAAHAAG